MTAPVVVPERVTVKVIKVGPASPSNTAALAIDRTGPAAWLDTTILSMPTHSSLPPALVVMIRISSVAALFGVGRKGDIERVYLGGADGPVVTSAK